MRIYGFEFYRTIGFFFFVAQASFNPAHSSVGEATKNLFLFLQSSKFGVIDPTNKDVKTIKHPAMAMRKLILEEWLSLDGYAADKNGQLDFFTNLSAEQNTYSDQDQLKFLETIDTILLGRKTYELFVDFWPAATTDKEVIADKLNQTNKIVFSNTLTEAPWGQWKAAEIISGETIKAIKRLKNLPGKDMVLWGSISLAQSLMQANLIDEYHLQICPVLINGGRSLFLQQAVSTNLKLLELRKYNTGVVFLNYVPVKQGEEI